MFRDKKTGLLLPDRLKGPKYQRGMLSAMGVRRAAWGTRESDSTNVTIGEYCPKSCVLFGYNNTYPFGTLSQSTFFGETIDIIMDTGSGSSGNFVFQIASDGTFGASWFYSLEVEDSDGTTIAELLASNATHNTDSSTFDSWSWSSVDPPDWYNDTSNVRTVTIFQ